MTLLNMDRLHLNELLVLLTVAEERSFTRAAARLGSSQSTVSHTVRRLEERLGVRLLTRTTRSVSPTEVGARLLDSLAPRIDAIEGELEQLMAQRDRPSGTVRLTVSDHAYQSVVWPKLPTLLDAYPEITVEISLDNGLRNIVEDRFDAGIRLGESLDKDMVAVRVGPDWRLVVVAAPRYFATRSMPAHPEDLVEHNCMNHRQARSGGLYAWEFARGGRELRVRVAGQLTFSSSLAMVDAALAGYGIAYVPESLVAEHLAAGRLVRVLDEWSPFFSGYHLYYPSRRQLSPALRVLVDVLRSAAR
jgi:DNA-binding transcriptional LysR family regulator